MAAAGSVIVLMLGYESEDFVSFTMGLVRIDSCHLVIILVGNLNVHVCCVCDATLAHLLSEPL